MRHDDTVRCETCLGMGYKGRQRGRGCKLETCRACGGRGSRPATEVQRPRRPNTNPADDPRYVASDDPRAVLRAWGGADEHHLTMDMGGWTDTDTVAFGRAV